MIGLMYSLPAGGSHSPSLGFLIWKGCWSHAKEGTSDRLKKRQKKRKKKSGFPFGCGLFASKFPFEAGSAVAGEGVCQMNRAFDTTLTSQNRIRDGASP